MRIINDKEDLEQIMGYKTLGTRFTEGFNRFKINLVENPKLYLKRTFVSLGLIAMLATGCKEAEAKPTYEETKEQNAVVETYKEPEIEEETEIVEEVKPTLEDKFKEYNLEDLMLQIQKKDPELYEHYTTGDIDALLPVLADISKYIPESKFLGRRPTAESLKELNNIILNLDNENDKKIYVENSFKTAEALIVTSYARNNLLNTLLPMWLSNQLNIDYTVVNNTNDQFFQSREYFEWWKNSSGMWDEVEPYYNIIQNAINEQTSENYKENLNQLSLQEFNKPFNELSSEEKIKAKLKQSNIIINAKTDEIFDVVAYSQNKEGIEKLVGFLTFDTLDGTSQVETLDGWYGGFNQNELVDKLNNTPLSIEGVWLYTACEGGRVKSDDLNQNNKFLSLTKSKIANVDDLHALIYLFLKNEYIIRLNELDDVLKGIGAIEKEYDGTRVSYFYIDKDTQDQKRFDIDPYNKYNLQVYSKNFENDPSVLYYHIKSIDDIKQ